MGMNKRLEAVAKSLADEDGWTSYSDAKKALAAADAVMFSEDTLEAIYDEFRLSPSQMRWLVGLLKGAGNE